MKLKCLPEDFQVEELTEFQPAGGSYALYRLTKRSVGTPEAIELVMRRWNIPRRRVSYGGLKDKHALTRQFVSIEQGPRRPFRERGVELEFLGYSPRPFQPQDIAGNRFVLVLRDLSEAALEHAIKSLREVAQDGLPNYFDDQRFGSVGQSRDFIGHAWCLGDFERALWLAVADPCEDDRAADKERKRLLREHWGRWTECKAALPRSHERSLVTYLTDHPTDFRGAFARLKVDLRGLYLSAFQSHLWNLLLAAMLRQHCPERLVDLPLKLGPFPFPNGGPDPLPAAISNAELPLPSARAKDELGPYEGPLLEILKPFGLEPRQLRVKYPRDSFFAKGRRAAIIRPAAPASRPDPDDLYPGREKLTLQFDLPRGSYATILVKRITLP